MRSAEVDSAVVACLVDRVEPPIWETFRICISCVKDTEAPCAEGTTAEAGVAATSSNISRVLDPAEGVAAAAEADC